MRPVESDGWSDDDEACLCTLVYLQTEKVCQFGMRAVHIPKQVHLLHVAHQSRHIDHQDLVADILLVLGVRLKRFLCFFLLNCR